MTFFALFHRNGCAHTTHLDCTHTLHGLIYIKSIAWHWFRPVFVGLRSKLGTLGVRVNLLLEGHIKSTETGNSGKSFLHFLKFFSDNPRESVKRGLFNRQGGFVWLLLLG